MVASMRRHFFNQEDNVNIFKRMEETKELINSMKYTPSSQAVEDVTYDFTALYTKLQLWLGLGAKTFRLSKELIDAFALTDVPMDITPGEFHYPFDTFLIEGEKPLFQVNIRENDNADVHALLFINSNAITHNETLLVTRNGEIKNDVAWDVSISGLSPGLDGFGLDHMWVNLLNNESIESACEKSKKPNQYRGVVTIPEAQRSINIFFNAIMYINEPGRKKEDTESVGHSKYKIKGQKRTVKSQYILLKPPKRYLSILNSGTGRKIEKRFTVRGHWTRQAYGKGRAFRKRIWILPYWKGPELSEIVSKTYKVE